MSNEELSQLFFLEREIKHLQAEISRFERKWFSPGLQEPVQELLAVLQGSLQKRRAEYTRGMTFIEAIPDPWIKKAFISRYIKGGTWLQIALEMNISEDCCKKMVQRYIKKQEIRG